MNFQVTAHIHPFTIISKAVHPLKLFFCVTKAKLASFPCGSRPAALLQAPAWAECDLSFCAHERQAEGSCPEEPTVVATQPTGRRALLPGMRSLRPLSLRRAGRREDSTLRRESLILV